MESKEDNKNETISLFEEEEEKEEKIIINQDIDLKEYTIYSIYFAMSNDDNDDDCCSNSISKEIFLPTP